MATMESLIGLVNRIQRACTALGDYGGGDSTFSSLWDALPSVAVVGGQSSGKSSVLESIVGRDFLPRGSGIVTRRPLVLQLHKTEGRQEEYAEFGHLPRRRFTDFALVRKEIADETDRITGKSKQISPIPIHLSIYSPHVVNLTLIDLPGLTKIAVEGQSETIVEDIENMVRLYVEKPNSIILAISPANQDIATSDAIKLAKEVDPTGERTFGVLTKLDLMDKGTNALDVLEGRAYKLQHPWVGIVNRSQADINKNTDMMYARRREREYFATSPDYGHLASKMGSEYLAKLLSQHLESVIKAKIPGITSLINKGIDEMEAELDRLGRPIAVDAGLGLKMRDAHRCDLGQKCRCAMRNANAHASRTRCAQGKQLAELLDEDPSLMSKRQDIAKQLQLYKSARVIIVHSIMEIEDWAASSSDSDVTAPDSDNDESYALPKLQFRKDISKARWKEELGMAEIVSNKGKLWTTTGIVRGGKIYSFLEDTLFLAEIGALHLLDDEDKCIPLVDIYKKVSEGVGGSSWESFEVYRHLKSLGYIIKRRGVCWSMKSAKSEESSCIMEVTNLFSSMGINEESKRLFFDVYSPNSKFRKSNPGNPIFILCVNGGNPPTKKDIEDLDGQCEGIPLKFCYVEHGRVSFISFNKIELPVIP